VKNEKYVSERALLLRTFYDLSFRPSGNSNM